MTFEIDYEYPIEWLTFTGECPYETQASFS
jgi:hypothetical protein